MEPAFMVSAGAPVARQESPEIREVLEEVALAQHQLLAVLVLPGRVLPAVKE
jgi:hypothetical protein